MSDRAAYVHAGELPDGWAWAELGSLGEWYGGSTPSKGNVANWNGDVPWISPKDMKQERIRETADHLTQAALSNGGPALVPSGAVVMVVRSGILRHTVPLAVTDLSATLNQDMKALVPYSGIDPDYLCWALRAHQAQILKTCTKHGTTVHNIVTESLHRLAVPIAPLPEQRRIVEKIEALLSEIANGVENLNAVDQKLDTYRQSVLKAAVTGELTRDWRRNRSQVVEAVPNSGSLPFKPPFEVPAGWRWATIGDLGSVSGGLTKNRKRSAHALQAPFLRVANVYHDELRLDDVHQVGLTERELEKTRLERDDLLVVEGNGSIDQIGRVALWDGSISDCVHQNHLIRVRFPYSALSRYALTWLLSPPGRSAIEAVAASTSGLHTLSIRKVSALPIPLPPDDELGEILGAVERASTADKSTNSAIASETARAASLRRSILNSAFAGRLVAQDPSDEPASEMLARIRAERTNAPKTSGRRGRPRKKGRTNEGANA